MITRRHVPRVLSSLMGVVMSCALMTDNLHARTPARLAVVEFPIPSAGGSPEALRQGRTVMSGSLKLARARWPESHHLA
jgi:hypothetical protein